MQSREGLVEALVRECPPRSRACIRAAWRYVIVAADPCGLVPLVRATRAEREYFLELARRFGLPRCDVAALVRHAAERLGLRPDVVGRAAEYARILRASGTTYRVAAAAGLIAAALEAGIYVPARCVAQVLRCTEAAAREALRRLRFALALRSR